MEWQCSERGGWDIVEPQTRQVEYDNYNDVEWQCGERGGWDIVESQTSQVEYGNYNDVEWQCGERGGWDIAGSQTRQSMVIIMMWNSKVVNGEFGILLNHRKGKV